MSHQNLVRRIAKSFHITTGLEYEELLSEAWVAYVEAIQTYRPEMSAMTTWIYRNVSQRLINFCSKEHSLGGQIPIPERAAYLTPESWASFRESMERLPIDARTICDVVLSMPTDLLMAPNSISATLTQHLRANGWRWQRIWTGFQDIKQLLREEL